MKTGERTLKAITLQIENGHPLGRLFDLDVIGKEGKSISREDLVFQNVNTCFVKSMPIIAAEADGIQQRH